MPPALDGRTEWERIHCRATRNMAMQAHEIAVRLLPTLKPTPCFLAEETLICLIISLRASFHPRMVMVDTRGVHHEQRIAMQVV